jgi:hypothetical protein
MGNYFDALRFQPQTNTGVTQQVAFKAASAANAFQPKKEEPGNPFNARTNPFTGKPTDYNHNLLFGGLDTHS